MAIEDTAFRFHESFSPQISYISKIVKLAAENFCGNRTEISNITGIPTGESSGKVIPHIKYANYMGLIECENAGGKINLSLTQLGTVIYEEDPYLMEEVTKLVLNFWLTDKKIGAPQWGFLFRCYSYSFENWEAMERIAERASEYFGKEIEMGVVKNTYFKECFETLNLIDLDSSGKQIRFNRIIPKEEAMYAYAYTLLKSWEMYFENARELTINQIIDELKWNRPFGFDYDRTLEVLDELGNIKILSLNKQLNPITIIKTSTSDEALSGVYSLLI